MPYRLLVPENYDPKKSYPLVLFLHGAGERGDDNTAQLVHLVGLFAAPENRAKYPCFVVAPQCPNELQWNAVSWTAVKHKFSEKPALPLALTLQLLTQLQKEYHIDTNRLYAMGISMGGFGTWDIIVRHPEMFAAAVPICGGADEATAPRIAKVPLWVFHGAVDSVVKVACSRNMVAALKEAGGRPRYTEYPACDHNSWDLVYQERDFLPWLFAQKRQQ